MTPKKSNITKPSTKSTEQELINQTLRWLEKIKNIEMEAVSEKGKEFLVNLDAYIHDSQYFFDKKDYVRSFEAVIWAWSIFELSKELGHIKQTEDNGKYGD